jgi:molybdenum cofactor biosynthesis enzyme MoaA
MERRSDMYISTLGKIIQGMGGELQIIAKMPNGRVQIRQFTKIRKARAAATRARSSD